MLGRLLETSPLVEVLVRNLYWRSPILPSLQAKLAHWTRSGAAKRTASEPSTSMARIIDVLRGWGVGAGDLLIVHSSYRSIRAGGASPEQVTDALLGLVGAAGTLAAPAIPIFKAEPKLYERMVADVSQLVLDYDPAATPCWTGALPAAMLRRPAAVRSPHPLNSLVALGPLAEAMMRDNLKGERPLPCGAHSAWKFCHDHGAKIVALGADMAHSLTMIHLAEDLLEERWPVTSWWRDRTFRVKQGGDYRTYLVRERHPKWAMYYGERALSKDLRRSGVCKHALVDGVNVELLEAQALIRYLNSRNAAAYPYFFIPKRHRRP